jgi:poly(3-hydroxybutyrate) depolymerase
MREGTGAFVAVVLAALAMVVAPRPAIADGSAASHVRGPCARCVASLPAGDDPRPLLVLLHGDNETADMMFGEWSRAAEARRVAVLALQCPVSEGCTQQSWWKWGKDPAWLRDQVKAVGGLRAIDPDRVWIVGWSGGASYIGMWTQEIERSFAAIVIHGGGMPPADATCSPAKPGVLFLVGSSNPLHFLAERLRDHYKACQNPVTWTLLQHADHAGERRGLSSHREAILDWLASQSLKRSP